MLKNYWPSLKRFVIFFTNPLFSALFDIANRDMRTTRGPGNFQYVIIITPFHCIIRVERINLHQDSSFCFVDSLYTWIMEIFRSR